MTPKHLSESKMYSLMRSDGKSFCQRLGSVAEWSKALVLGTSHFGGVGSNPTTIKLLNQLSEESEFDYIRSKLNLITSRFHLYLNERSAGVITVDGSVDKRSVMEHKKGVLVSAGSQNFENTFLKLEKCVSRESNPDLLLGRQQC